MLCSYIGPRVRGALLLREAGVFLFTLANLTEALIIVIALSVDTFVSGVAYGTSGIKIPIGSAVTVNIITSAILAAALLFGGFLGSFMSPEATTAVCAALLLILGAGKIFDSAVKAFIRRHRAFRREYRFSVFNLGVILNIYANPEHADRDNSSVLSISEAALLALALSIDGLAVGFGAGVSDTAVLPLILLSLLPDIPCLMLGSALGGRAAKKLGVELSWLSGILLVSLALTKLF